MNKLAVVALMALLGACSKSEDCAAPEAKEQLIQGLKSQLPSDDGHAPDKYEVQDIRTEKIDKELKTTFCAANVELSRFSARGVTFTKPVTWKVPGSPQFSRGRAA